MKRQFKFGNILLITGLIMGILISGLLSSKRAQAQADTVDEEDFSVVMITSDPNEPGASFILNGWEGLITFGRENKVEEGEDGYHLLTVYEEKDYQTHFETALAGDYDLIIAMGNNVEKYVDQYARENEDQKFLLLDSKLELPNLTSVLFKDHEAAYLAGIAAGLETESNLIGFIGGFENDTIRRFEEGFLAGVEAVNEEAEVEVAYLESFNDREGAETATLSMYEEGADIVFHAAGVAGMGVFEAAQTYISETGQEVRVIGADVDQTEVGEFIYGDESYSITLTSTMKKVGNVVYDLTHQAMAGELQPGVYEYGMADDAIDIAAGNLEGETLEIVGDYRDQMRAGEYNIDEVVKSAMED